MKGFQKIFPASGRNLFDGGMNSKYQPTLIEDSESPDCLNVVFSDGGVGTRDGFSKVNTAAVGSYVCEGLYTRVGNNSVETMVAFFNGSAFTLDNTSLVTIPSAQSIFTVGARVGSAQMENHIFFGNGGVNPYKYNGAAFTLHGVKQASQVASFNSNGAGSPNGDYQYKFTFVNSALVEGNPSDASTTFTVSSKIINVSSIPVGTASWGVASRKIYRTVAGGTTFKLVATISDNTTTSYDDNIADAALGANAPSEKGMPPKYSTIIYHKSRLFMNDTDNPSFVWYTDLNEPYTVASTNFIIVGDGSTDLVQAFEVQDDQLVVFCRRNVHIVYMQDTDPANWYVLKSKSAYTSRSPFGSFLYNNKVAFPAMQNDKFVGIAALSGDTVEPTQSLLSTSSVASELKSDPIEEDMFDIQESYVRNISSIVFKNIAYIAMTKASGNTTNNRVYIMDFSITRQTKKKREAWAPWTGLNVAQFAIYSGSLYYGTSTATGFIYKQAAGVYADDGTAINSYFWTKEFSGLDGHDSFFKDFRYANLLFDLAGTYFMDVAIKNDSDSGSGTNTQIDLDPQTQVWGTMVWGVDPWGGGNFQKDLQHPLGTSRGKRIQFKFSNRNTANQRFKVHWLNFTYNLKGLR